MKRITVAALLVVVAAACTQSAEPDSSIATSTTEAIAPNAEVTYTVRQIAKVEGAVDIVERSPDDNWIYIVGRDGIVERWNRSSNARIDRVLDISKFTNGEGERGLLGLAFRERNSAWTAFVNYTNTDGDTTIASFPVRDDGTIDASQPSGREILVIEQPYSNHNGGGIAVGPDNMVYIGMGDGGSANDPERYSLNMSSLLGKMLRIDPRDEGGYDIPTDNPFVTTSGARGEIWSIGLRNPWRFSFDSQGNLWVADVGQGNLEEVSAAKAEGATPGGRGISFGWSAYEGSARFNEDVSSAGALMPVHEYTHTNGACSISGGAVGTNTATPSRAGWYFFGDYCTGKVTAILTDGEKTVLEEPVAEDFSNITAVRT
ncbi:MAG: glucose dehydrogenase, partial [Actinobacteria bacterium]|nr:glucose dehydrogenase [Actinomycetota bacterium]